MEKLSTRKHTLLLFFLAIIATNNIIVLPVYASAESYNDDEQKSTWDQAQHIADCIMDRVQTFHALGKWLGETYKNHRYGQQYTGGILHFGDPVEFAEGANSDNYFNQTNNILRFLVEVKKDSADNKAVKFGAVKERDYVYYVFLNEDGKVKKKVTKDQFTTTQGENFYTTFACNALLYKKENSKAVRNLQGYPIVTKGPPKNRQPVMYNGELVFLNNTDHQYYNEKGQRLGSKEAIQLDTLPTIDTKYYPHVAVSLVLAGTVGSALGTGLTACNILKWCCENIFGEKQKAENQDNKKENINLKATEKTQDTESKKQNPEKQSVKQAEPDIQPEPQQFQQTQSSTNKKDTNKSQEVPK